MTKEQVKLVKKSWRIFRSINPVLVGDLFYSKLFADNPALRKMFPSKMDEQYAKLIDMISVVVTRLDNLEELTADIAAMAERHVGYGTKPEHYVLVGKALLWTLEKGMGSDWNQELADAWTTCYTLLADTMIKSTT
jgi:hemoglobin-like flavoprotein